MRLKAGSPSWLTLTEEANSYKLAGTNNNLSEVKAEVILEVFYPLYEANFIKEVPFTVELTCTVTSIAMEASSLPVFKYYLYSGKVTFDLSTIVYTQTPTCAYDLC